MFDCSLLNKYDDAPASLMRLAEMIHDRYPGLIPKSYLWGVGRPRWDPSAR